MENKCEGSENKILLGDFNITIGIMDRDGGNKTTRNMQNQAISKMYTDDNKSKHSSNPTDILKSAKKFIWKTLYQRDNFQNYHYWIY